MQSACRLAWDVILNTRRDRGICLVSSLFLTRVGVYLSVRLCIRIRIRKKSAMSPFSGGGFLTASKDRRANETGIYVQCLLPHVRGIHSGTRGN